MLLKRFMRRQMCKEHFGSGDMVIDGYRLNPVHTINTPLAPGAELDFYMDTGEDCYLLRLRNVDKNTITLCKHLPHSHNFIYIVIEKSLRLSIDAELQAIVCELKKICIPKKIYREIVYHAFA